VFAGKNGRHRLARDGRGVRCRGVVEATVVLIVITRGRGSSRGSGVLRRHSSCSAVGQGLDPRAAVERRTPDQDAWYSAEWSDSRLRQRRNPNRSQRSKCDALGDGSCERHAWRSSKPAVETVVVSYARIWGALYCNENEGVGV
jgi:hypothetical protein